MAADSIGPVLSVVVCTYNRPDLVAQVLETIAQQDAPSEAYEVLVIDNASPRDIASVVQPFEGRIPGLRCIREERVGLSHARNRGWLEARGEYVGYVDDDCKLPQGWVSTALRIISEVHPIMFGGPYRAFYMTPKPRWFRDEYGSAGLGDEACYVPGECLSGNNMVIRKDALEAVGGFDPSLGMTGMTMAYGEETALQKALWHVHGAQAVYYDPALYVFHLVRPEKMNVPWMVRRRILGGYTAACIDGDAPLAGLARASAMLAIVHVWARFLFRTGRGLVRRDRSRYPNVRNLVWESTSHILAEAGRNCARLRRR